MWHYNKADTNAIRKSMISFPWAENLRINTDPNWQVKTFHETFINIMSNFIPNEVKKCIPRDPPWINKSLKTLLRKKDRLYRNNKNMAITNMTKLDSRHFEMIINML